MKRIWLYALLSLGSFIGALVLIGLMLWNVALLSRFGLTGNFYYLILLPLGLAVAAFLFGTLRSWAHYSGKALGGALELGGPIVGFLLVVILGFVLPSPQTNFSLTVYVHGPEGPQHLVLTNQGFVMLDLGGDRRQEPIGNKAQVVFAEIPASYRGQDVYISLISTEFESVETNPRSLDGNTLYLPIRKQSVTISGRIQDENGKPIEGASVDFEDLSTTSNANGYFELGMPGERMKPRLVLQVTVSGFKPRSVPVYPGSNDVVVVLGQP